MDSVNIIVLDMFEDFITWLDSEKCDIKENCKKENIRTINVTYPLEEIIDADTLSWFEQGNKIYIPSGLGLDACLYVINTDYTIDFWNGNNVSFEAEEVLTELNNVSFFYAEDAITINKNKLSELFGQWFDIGIVDGFTSGKNKIAPCGSMTLMDLLRQIEEDTDHIVTTQYSLKENNQIQRTLNLRKPENVGTRYDKDILDLGQEVENLEYTKDESNVYSAMSPKFSLQETNTTDTTSNVASTNGATTKEEMKQLITNWKNLEIQFRESIPMIIQKDSQGNITYPTYWFAPFEKRSGDMYMTNPTISNANYTEMLPYNPTPYKRNPIVKQGMKTTNETDMYAIYNDVATEFLKHKEPELEIKVELHDIHLLLGDVNKSYNIYDVIYVKVPGFTYYIPCTVTQTTKNPHLPGENKITLKNEVTGKYLQKTTSINTSNYIHNGVVPKVGGVLVDEDGKPLSDKIININARLSTPYNTSDGTISTASQTFQPDTYYYVFSNTEIEEMAKYIKNYIIYNNTTPKSVYMRTTDQKVYEIPYLWCRAIYYSRNRWIQARENIDGWGKGQPSSTIQVHHYAEEGNTAFNLLKKEPELRYWSSAYYDMMLEQREYIKQRFSISHQDDPVNSSSLTEEGMMKALPILFELIWDYLTPYSIEKGMNSELNDNNLVQLEKMGYTTAWINCTWQNIKKYTSAKYKVALLVDYYYLPTHELYHKSHEYSMMYVSWCSNDDEQKYVFATEGAHVVWDPYKYKDAEKEIASYYYSWDILKEGVCAWFEGDNIMSIYGGANSGWKPTDANQIMFMIGLTKDNVSALSDGNPNNI